jgi:hypothetical protein
MRLYFDVSRRIKRKPSILANYFGKIIAEGDKDH